MKRNNIKNLLGLVTIILIAASTQSCVKSREGRTEFDNLQPFVLIREGGLATFGSQALTFPASNEADTVYFRVNYAAKTVAPTDITITLGYDEAALNSYNSTAPDQYQKFPDSIYSFTTTTVTIKAGQQFSDLIPLIVYPSKVDPTTNYLLPISITNGGGAQVSGSFGTYYPHFIGNPIAGAYLWNFHRWNAADSTSVPISGLSFDGEETIFAPINPTTIEVQSGYYILPHYVVTFDNDGGTLSNFQVTLNDDDVATMAAGGVSVASAPVFLIADPANKHYKIQWTALSSTAGPRYITDEFYIVQ